MEKMVSMLVVPEYEVEVEAQEAYRRTPQREEDRFPFLAFIGRQQAPLVKVDKKLEEFKQDTKEFFESVVTFFDVLPEIPTFELDTVDIEVGFNAEGKLVWLAKAGLDGGIKLHFKKSKKK